MRLARLAMLTLLVAGCGGGSKVVVQEVPNSTANLTVKGGEALAPKATSTPTADASATATPDASTAPAQTQQQPQQSTTQQPSQTPAPSTPQGTAGGGAAAPDATPAPGSDAQQFETYCQQNAGAC